MEREVVRCIPRRGKARWMGKTLLRVGGGGGAEGRCFYEWVGGAGRRDEAACGMGNRGGMGVGWQVWAKVARAWRR